MKFETKEIAGMPDAIAPDGSEVRVLCGLSRGGFAVFSLPPNAVSKAVAHHTVEELWYIVSGIGRMWRKLGGQEEIVELRPGLSLSIPVGTHFQFRGDGSEPLRVLGATMPPWPGEGEAYAVEGRWEATGRSRNRYGRLVSHWRRLCDATAELPSAFNSPGPVSGATRWRGGPPAGPLLCERRVRCRNTSNGPRSPCAWRLLRLPVR